MFLVLLYCSHFSVCLKLQRLETGASTTSTTITISLTSLGLAVVFMTELCSLSLPLILRDTMRDVVAFASVPEQQSQSMMAYQSYANHVIVMEA